MERWIEEFKLEADGDNWSPAVMRAQLSVPQYTPLELRFQATEYRFTSRVDIIRSLVRFVGSHNQYATTTTADGFGCPTLRWVTPGSTGIETHYPNTYQGRDYGSGYTLSADSAARGGGFQISGFALVGPGNGVGYYTGGSIEDHAIEAHSGFEITDCFIKGFRGSPIYANAGHSSTINLGNVNSSQIRRVLAQRCGAPAIWTGGEDCNTLSIRDCSIVECGLDMPARVETYGLILTGRQCTTVTITGAIANSTLYRARIASTNCDFTSPSSGTTMQVVVDGVLASINTTVGATVTAVQIDDDTILVYADSNAAFSITGTPIGVTQSTIVSNSATPTEAVCIGGTTSHELRIGDICQAWLPGQAFGGWLRGVVTDVRAGYGYLRVDYGMDQIDYEIDSIANVSGNTWRITLGVRGHAHLGHIGRTIAIYGCTNAGNNSASGFPITYAQGSVAGTTSIRLRVVAALDNGRFWFDVARLGQPAQRLAITTGTGQTITQKKDAIVAAINAAGITGVTATSHDSDEFNIVGTDIRVSPGPYIETSTVGYAETVIEYTNASGVAEASCPGQFMISRVGVQGAYSGTWEVTGRITQVNDGPLIWNVYERILVNGDGHGDGFWSRSGQSAWRSCYTEGSLIAAMNNTAYVDQGNMNLLVGAKGIIKASVNRFSPSVEAGLLTHGDGGVVGRIGSSTPNGAFEFQVAHATADEVWRWQFEQTTQGAGFWELVADNVGTGVARRMAAGNNLRLPQGAESLGNVGSLYTNFGNGSVATPLGMTAGLAGLVEYAMNGSYPVAVDPIRIFLISAATNATPIQLTIGTHNFPSGRQGRMLVRSVAGNTAANGHRSFTQFTSSSVRLYDLDGTTGIAGNGTHTANSGIAIWCRLVARWWVTGTTFSPADGNWLPGDRLINVRPQSGDGLEWVCTAGGVGGASTWALVGAAL